MLTLRNTELDMMIDDAADRFRDAYGIEDLTDPSQISQVCDSPYSFTSRADFRHYAGLNIRLWPNHLDADRYR